MNAADLRLIDVLLNQTKDQIMAEFEDRIAELNRSFDEKTTFITDAIAALRAEVAEAKANGVTPERLAALDAIDAKIDAFDPTKPVTIPEGTEPGTPPTEPTEPPTDGTAPEPAPTEPSTEPGTETLPTPGA